MKDEGSSSQAEVVELDKLNVSSTTVPAPETPSVEENEEKRDVSSRKVSPLKGVLGLFSRKKMFISALLSGLLIGSIVIYIFLTRRSSDGPGSENSYVGNVVYEVSSRVADRHYIGFRLSIPFKDNKEKDDLMQKLPVIRDRFSICDSHSGLMQSIQKKDLGSVKKHILRLVNELTGVPVESLRMEGLTLEPTVRKRVL